MGCVARVCSFNKVYLELLLETAASTSTEAPQSVLVRICGLAGFALVL